MPSPRINTKFIGKNGKYTGAYLHINNNKNIIGDIQKEWITLSDGEIYELLNTNFSEYFSKEISNYSFDVSIYLDGNGNNFNISFKLDKFFEHNKHEFKSTINKVFRQLHHRVYNKILNSKTQNALKKCKSVLQYQTPSIFFDDKVFGKTCAEIDIDNYDSLYVTMSEFMVKHNIYSIFKELRDKYATTCVEKLANINISAEYNPNSKYHHLVEISINQLSINHRNIVSKIFKEEFSIIYDELKSQLYKNNSILQK